jgi:hypothetical protein
MRRHTERDARVTPRVILAVFLRVRAPESH